MVTIRLYAWLREEVGVGEIRLGYRGPISGLLLLLRLVLGDTASSIFGDDGQLKHGIVLGLNNRIVNPKMFKEEFVDDCDVVDIMPLGSGG